MTELITSAVAMAHALAEKAERDAQSAQASALARARSVAYVVELCGGNHAEAGRRLGLDQSTVYKLVQKAKNRDDTTPLLWARDVPGLTDAKPVFARDALINSDPYSALASTAYDQVKGHEAAVITGHQSGELSFTSHPDNED